MKSLPFPKLFTFEIESRCNNNCVGCGNVFSHTNNLVSSQLSLCEWDSIIKQIGPHAKSVKLTGGEPTLSPLFFPILASLEKWGIPYYIFTNGRWKDKGVLIKRLQRSRLLLGMLISLHGADADSHEAFTGVDDSYQEVLSSIKIAAPYVNIALNVVMTARNYQQIEAMVDLAKSSGAKSISFSRYIGLPITEITPTVAQLSLAIKKIESLQSKEFPLHYGPCIPQCFVSSQSRGCWAGIASCTIDPWGYIKPCTHSILKAGNLIQSNLETLWNGPIFQKWREMVPQDCTECDLIDICGGGCKAQMLIDSSNKDALAGNAVSHALPTKRVILPASSYPRFFGEIISSREAGKYFLLNGGRVCCVNHATLDLICNLRGNLTLGQLKNSLSQSSFDVIVALIHEGVICLDHQSGIENFKPKAAQ